MINQLYRFSNLKAVIDLISMKIKFSLSFLAQRKCLFHRQNFLNGIESCKIVIVVTKGRFEIVLFCIIKGDKPTNAFSKHRSGTSKQSYGLSRTILHLIHIPYKTCATGLDFRKKMIFN